jgi:hypothetical protein
VIGAVFWPVALFVATEILTRVAWPSGLGWQLVRWLGMLPVAAVAALVSYRHLSGLLGYYGEDPVTVRLGPLAVDGLMVISAGALLATGIRQLATPVSVSAPAAATPITVPTPPAVPAPSTTPDAAGDPVSPPSTEPAPTPDSAGPARTDVPTPAHVATRVTPSPTTLPLRSTADRSAAAPAPRPRPRKSETTPSAAPLAAPAADTSVTEPEPAQLSLPMPVAPDLLGRAREVARQYQAEHGTPITAGQLAARLKVNSDVAAQALHVLDLGPDSPTQKIPTVNGKPVRATR